MMSKHKPPTENELAQWEEYRASSTWYGSRASHDAVRRMIVEIHNLREKLEEYGIHKPDCIRNLYEHEGNRFLMRNDCDCGLTA